MSTHDPKNKDCPRHGWNLCPSAGNPSCMIWLDSLSNKGHPPDCTCTTPSAEPVDMEAIRDRQRFIERRMGELQFDDVSLEEMHRDITDLLTEVTRLTEQVQAQAAEIERLTEFAKTGPYDESSARRAMALELERDALLDTNKDQAAEIETALSALRFLLRFVPTSLWAEWDKKVDEIEAEAKALAAQEKDND